MMHSADPEQEVSCVNSYVINGGVTQPFETLSIKISQRRLNQMIPEPGFIDSIVPSKTQLMVYGYGTSQFVVTRVQVGGTGADRVCNIDAVSTSQQYQSSVTNKLYNQSMMPFEIIKDILTRNEYGQYDSRLRFEDDALIVYYDDAYNNWGGGNISFPTGTNVWRVLQICAIKLGCKIWFEGGKAHVIYYRNPDQNHSYVGGAVPNVFDKVSLYTEEGSLSESIVGHSDVTDDGIDSVINVQVVGYGTGSDAVQYPSPWDLATDPSVRYYGERAGTRINIPEIDINSPQIAYEIASSIVSYRQDIQRQVFFKVKEVGAKGWEQTFPSVGVASRIYDEVNEVVLSNISQSKSNFSDPMNPVLVEERQRCILSEHKYHYPEGYTGYTWGKLTNVDLPQALSNLVAR